jgi:putative FmdB family regulatory protein
MPTYQYQCKKCGNVFDHFQKMTDARLTHCTCCKAGKVKRLIGSGAGIIFKGSGFYETDYRRPNSAKKEETVPASDKAAETKKTEKTSATTGD